MPDARGIFRYWSFAWEAERRNEGVVRAARRVQAVGDLALLEGKAGPLPSMAQRLQVFEVILDKIDAAGPQKGNDIVKRCEYAVRRVAAIVNHDIHAGIEHVGMGGHSRGERGTRGCVRLDELHIAILEGAPAPQVITVGGRRREVHIQAHYAAAPKPVGPDGNRLAAEDADAEHRHVPARHEAPEVKLVELAIGQQDVTTCIFDACFFDGIATITKQI